MGENRIGPSNNNKKSSSQAGLGLRWWLIAFGVCFLLYLGTTQRSICWQDSGWNQLRALGGDYSRSVSLARAHVLYIAGGHLAAKISPQHMPFVFNALSAFWMAVAMANLAAVGVLLTGRRWIGLVVATTLAVCHTVWWLATINESYAWVAAGLTAELYLLIVLIRKPSWKVLLALMFVNGLGLCVHNFALLPLPVYAIVALMLVIKRKLPAWSLLAAGGGYLLGAGVFIGMIVELAIREGSLGLAIGNALTGEYAKDVMNTAGLGGSKFWKANMAISAMNFLNLLLPLAVVGAWRLRRYAGGGLAVAIFAITFIEVVFFVRYPVPDQFMFILPTLVMAAALACVGLDVLARRSRRWRIVLFAVMLGSVIWQPIAYVVAAEQAGPRVAKIRKRELPFRNEAEYWLTPWKHNKDSARKFAELALEEASPNGVILADNTSIFPLVLAKRLAGGDEYPNVSIFRGRDFLSSAEGQDVIAFREKLAGRPLFIVHSQPGCVSPEVIKDAELSKTPAGSLYLVSWPDGSKKPPAQR